jgi:2-dehydro-3-deoxygluconokinase
MAEFAGEERGRLSTVRAFRRGYGGDTSNFAVAAARLGASAGYITRVGGDEFGSAFLILWRSEGVDVSQVKVEPRGFTGVYFIALCSDRGHEFTYYRHGSAASRITPADLDPAYLRGARLFHTSGISQAISESCRAAVDAAITAARTQGVMVSYDLNIRPGLWPPTVARAVVEGTIPRADIVFLSGEDIGHLYGGTPPEELMAMMLAAGPRLVVLKQGEDGCLILSADGQRVQVPAWPVDVVDTTGAGDAFAAAFAVEWLRGVPLEQAGRFANAVGALTAAGLGAVEPIPTRVQVEEFMAVSRTAP